MQLAGQRREERRYEAKCNHGSSLCYDSAPQSRNKARRSPSSFNLPSDLHSDDRNPAICGDTVVDPLARVGSEEAGLEIGGGAEGAVGVG